MSVEIIYETHATTTDNELGIATGWLPGRLSEAGRRQARELGIRRRADDIAAIFVSDLARAVATAEIAFSGNRPFRQQMGSRPSAQRGPTGTSGRCPI